MQPVDNNKIFPRMGNLSFFGAKNTFNKHLDVTSLKKNAGKLEKTPVKDFYTTTPKTSKPKKHHKPEHLAEKEYKDLPQKTVNKIVGVFAAVTTLASIAAGNLNKNIETNASAAYQKEDYSPGYSATVEITDDVITTTSGAEILEPEITTTKEEPKTLKPDKISRMSEFNEVAYIKPSIRLASGLFEVPAIVDVENDTVDETDESDEVREVEEPEFEDEAIKPDQNTIEKLNRIFNQNPRVKKAFDYIELALMRCSKELGQNITQVLKNKTEELNSNVPIPVVISVIERESKGFMTDWETGGILESSKDAKGFMQITRICEKDINTRLADDGKIRNRSNKSDNIDMGIILLNYYWNGCDGNLAKVLTGYNNGSDPEITIANSSAHDVKYIENGHYKTLSQYPEIWEYILNRDYLKAEDDGIYHVGLLPNGDADYDYEKLNYEP